MHGVWQGRVEWEVDVGACAGWAFATAACAAHELHEAEGGRVSRRHFPCSWQSRSWLGHSLALQLQAVLATAKEEWFRIMEPQRGWN